MELLQSIDYNLLQSNLIFNCNYFEDWIKYIDTTERTAENYKKNLKQFYLYLQEKNIIDPSRQDIINFKNYLFEKGLKSSTVACYLQSVKSFFNWLENSGLYKNISKNIKNPQQPQGFKKDYLTQSQMIQLLQSIDTTTIKGFRDFALILLMLETGLRVNEVCNINVDDISKTQNQFIIYVLGKGYKDKSNFVIISDYLYNILQQYQNLKKTKTIALFTSTSKQNNNLRLSARSVSGIVKEHLRAIGLDDPRLTAHSLRHTFATQSYLQGAKIEEVSQALRHKSINITMRYLQALDKVQNPCNKLVDGIIQKGITEQEQTK